VVQGRHEAEVLGAGEQVVDRGHLAGHADRRPHLLRVRGHVVPGDDRGAAVRRQQRGQDADDRGLPGAVRAEQRGDRAPLDGEVDAVEHDLVAEGLAQAAYRDRGICGRHGGTPIAGQVW
jgi:hypothetical protein